MLKVAFHTSDRHTLPALHRGEGTLQKESPGELGSPNLRPTAKARQFPLPWDP